MSPAKRRTGKTPVRSNRVDEISEHGDSGFPVHVENTANIIGTSPEAKASESLPSILSVENSSDAKASVSSPSVLSAETFSDAKVLERGVSTSSIENNSDAKSYVGNSGINPQEHIADAKTTFQNPMYANVPTGTYLDPSYIYSQLQLINVNIYNSTIFMNNLHSRIASLETKNSNTQMENQSENVIQQGDPQVEQATSVTLIHSESSGIMTVNKVPSSSVAQDNVVTSPSESSNNGSPPELINHTQNVDLSMTGASVAEEDEDSYNSTFSEDTAELPFGVNPENVNDQEGVQHGNGTDHYYESNNHHHPDILSFCEKQIERLENVLNKTISNFNKKSKEHTKEYRSIGNRILNLSNENEKTMTSLSHHFDERLLKNHQVLSQKIDEDFEVMNVFRVQTNSALDSLNNLAKKTSDLILNLNNEIKTGEVFKDLSQSVSQAVDDIEEIKIGHSLLEAQFNRQGSEIYHEIDKLKEEQDIRTDSNKNLSQLIQDLPSMISSVVQSVTSKSSILPNENPFTSKFVRNYFYPPLVSKLVIAGQGGCGPQALESVREFISRIISIFKTVHVLPDNKDNFDNLRRLFESCLDGEALSWARNPTVALGRCRDLPFCGPFDSPEKVLLVNVPTQDGDTENGKRFSYLELFLMRFVPFVGPDVFDSIIATEISKEVKRTGDGNYLSAKKINDLIQRYSMFISISAALKFKIFSNAVDPVLFSKVKNYEEYTKRARLQTHADFDWIVNKVIDRESIETDPVKKLNAVLGINGNNTINATTNNSTDTSAGVPPTSTILAPVTTASNSAAPAPTNSAVPNSQQQALLPFQHITTDNTARIGRVESRLDYVHGKVDNLQWNFFQTQQKDRKTFTPQFENRSNQNQTQPFSSKSRMIRDPPQNQTQRDPPLGSNGFQTSNNTSRQETNMGQENQSSAGNPQSAAPNRATFRLTNNRSQYYNTRGRDAIVSALTFDEKIRFDQEGSDCYEILISTGVTPDVANEIANEHAFNYAEGQFLQSAGMGKSDEDADALGGAAPSSA